MASEIFLTFNTELSEYVNMKSKLGPLEANSEPLADKHPLRDKWRVWEQVIPLNATTDRHDKYSNATKCIAAFDTAEEFWKLWNSLPQPSKLLQGKRMFRESSDDERQQVDAIMIFKDGIKPEWEEPCNANGGHFEYKLRNSKPAQLDEYWNNLVLSLIGATLKPSEIITGVRLVDKLHVNHTRNQQSIQGNVRLEIWFSDMNHPDVQVLHQSIDQALAAKLDGTTSSVKPPTAGEAKSHCPSGR